MKFKKHIIIAMTFIFLLVNSNTIALAKSKPITIKSISNISVQVVQNRKYALPKVVTGIMSNNTKKMINVKWNATKIETRKVGTYNFIGTVNGYRKGVLLKLIVTPFVIKPAYVKLNKTVDNLTVGKTDALIPTLSPSNTTNKAVTWKSSNETVATVDENGKVTAIKEGMAIITCTTKDTSKNSSCTIIVNNPEINATSLSLNKTTDSLIVGETDKLIATISPENVTNKNIKWTSTNPLVATVDENGKVTAISTGTAEIVAINNHILNTCRISVDSIITFKDANLEEAVRNKINKPTGILYKRDVEGITQLKVIDKGVKSIDGIEKLTNLTLVDLGKNQISDISPLKKLDKLQILILYNNPVNDISALKSLTNLSELDLFNINIKDISALKDLTNLERLMLNSTGINDISVLKELTNLQQVILDKNEISDISVLKGLTNLKVLHLNDNQISDINVLKDLTDLKEIQLSNNQINDISGLKDLTNLEELYLNNNKISEIVYPLKSLNNLTSLHLEDNQISDISGLKGLTNLKKLYLNNNEITDISPLEGLIGLTNLDLTNNFRITDTSVLDKLNNLQNVDYLHKQIACYVKENEIIKNVIKPGMSEYDKELALHDYVCLNAQYDSENYYKGTIPNDDYTAFGILVNKIGVCQGYADAMNELLNRVGIKSQMVFGTGNGESHAWNIVKINENYYNLDATWDDQGDSLDTIRHTYFNITDKELSKDHEWNTADYPKCTATDKGVKTN